MPYESIIEGGEERATDPRGAGHKTYEPIVYRDTERAGHWLAFRSTTTSTGALSASSSTHTRPWIAALTNGASSYTSDPLSRIGLVVRAATVQSRCSCTYSRSQRSSCNSRSTCGVGHNSQLDLNETGQAHRSHLQERLAEGQL